tara:strand:- start:802 stop:1425 length:624 start_codon:yes stop_codon:yes gene_type:complete
MQSNLKFILLIYFLFSCYNNPAIKSSYNFFNVKSVEVLPIEDHSYLQGSGKMIANSISHNFLKLGFDVNQSNDGNNFIFIGNGNKKLILSCLITEFTDSELIIVPYKYENRGYTETVLNQSSTDSKKNKKNADLLTTTSTKTHGGSITEGSKVEYSRAKVGIILTMKDKLTGDLVWSNSYWYSGLELHKTTESCVRQGISQLGKLFN